MPVAFLGYVPLLVILLRACQGCVVQPFAISEQLNLPVPITQPLVSSTDIARCTKCLAYINPYAVFDQRNKWRCPLCHEKNDDASDDSRYASEAARQNLPELLHGSIEYQVNTGNLLHIHNTILNDSLEEGEEANHAPTQMSDLPIFIAVVDITGRDCAFMRCKHSHTIRWISLY